ncbi:tigger transposable element-derived protein 1-like [Palaemon carinicauda]|uniref:tigger transposable element-derived protein 1-like n=1 Tax=Palaemon carinicauda TaxID=392227 RepID=UPI0035B586AE
MGKQQVPTPKPRWISSQPCPRLSPDRASSPNNSSTAMKLAIFRRKCPGGLSSQQRRRDNRLTLPLCAIASGDCKVKPLLVYHSDNPCAFKSQGLLKEKLQVIWRTNAKAWVTRHFFTECVNLCFGPAVKKYLAEKKLALKCLLVLDNVPGHLPGLENDILDEFRFIKALYLPPNTTTLLQPIFQQVISNFKKLYTKYLFKKCFNVTDNTNLAIPEFWKEHFNIVHCLKIIDDAWQGSMGLEVDKADVNDLVEEQQEEFTTLSRSIRKSSRHRN